MPVIGGISVRNFYDSLVDTEVEQGDEAPVIADAVDGLCRDLQNVALDNGQSDLYLRGEVVRQPLGEMGMTIDACFLAAEEGKRVVQVIDSLKRCQRLVFRSHAAMWDKANQWFGKGTCVGQSMAFMLSRRPKSINELRFWTESERVDAVFFQMNHNLYYHQSESMGLQVAQLQKTEKDLISQRVGIEQRIAFKKYSIESIQTSVEKIKNKARKTFKDKVLIKSSQSRLSTFSKQFAQMSVEKNRLNQRIKSMKKKIEKLRKKLSQQNTFQTLLDKLQQKKLDDAGINFFGSRAIVRANGKNRVRDQESFRKNVRQALSKEFEDENLSDFVLVFGFDAAEMVHYILVQPGHTQPRIYDSEVGELLYKSQKDLLDDLEDYQFLTSVNSLKIKKYGPFYVI